MMGCDWRALSWAAGLALVTASASAAAPRAMIYVAEVMPADEHAKAALQDWGTAFKFGLDPLITELSAGDPGAATPQIVLASVSDAPSIAQLKDLSDSGQAVQVSSAISQWSDAFSVITMTIYLGSLKGGLASPVLTLQQKVLAGNYRADRDALALVALYAWGQEAVARQPPGARTAACGYFARARLIGRAIVAQVTEVAPVLVATEKGLSENRCPHA